MNRLSLVPVIGLIAAAVAFGLRPAAVVAQSTTPPFDPPAVTDLAYAGTNDPLQTLDVYLPEGAAAMDPLPAILVIHGGGFRAGDKADVRPVAAYLALQGYAVFAVNYRLTPDDIYPAQVEDVFCATGWMLANAAEYNLDPAHFYLWGGSAGATLALMISAVDDRDLYSGSCPTALPDDFSPAGVVAYYPATDFVNLTTGDAPTLVDYLGGTLPELPDRWAEASPLTWVDGNEPPTLLLHGTRDRTTGIRHSREYYAALQTAGVEAALYELEGADHGFMNRIRTDEGREAGLVAVDFLNRLAGKAARED